MTHINIYLYTLIIIFLVVGVCSLIFLTYTLCMVYKCRSFIDGMEKSVDDTSKIFEKIFG